MFKIGLVRYFNNQYTIKASLESVKHYDLLVIITHLSRPGELRDKSFEIVEQFIKENPNNKIIHRIFEKPVYPAWHSHFKSNYPNVTSTAEYYNFGLCLIWDFILSNNININNVVISKVDTDIIEICDPKFYKNNERLLTNYVCVRNSIDYYAITNDFRILHRPMTTRCDYITVPGKLLPKFKFVQSHLYEVPSFYNKKAKVQVISLNFGEPYAYHVDKLCNYENKNGYDSSVWTDITETAPVIVKSICEEMSSVK